jgi:Type VI secretion system/phage-baseplate injector OB domain
MLDADDDDPRYGRQPPRRYYGKYAGLVLDNSPPSSGAHRGEIKVKVPGILEEKPGGSDNQPIELLAAPAFLPGFFFVPEKDAPVWVEFVAGDINFPIWTGVWYPKDAAPKTADSEAPTLDQKVIRTRSGQVIQLDDTDGSEKLVIKDEKNKSTITLDSGGIKIEAGASGGSVTLTFGQTTVTLKDESIEIDQGGTNSIKMSASGVAISTKAGTTITDATGLIAQPVVLAPVLDWLLSHQHLGNMGAPTPLFPSDIVSLNVLKKTSGVTKAG